MSSGGRFSVVHGVQWTLLQRLCTFLSTDPADSFLHRINHEKLQLQWDSETRSSADPLVQLKIWPHVVPGFSAFERLASWHINMFCHLYFILWNLILWNLILSYWGKEDVSFIKLLPADETSSIGWLKCSMAEPAGEHRDLWLHLAWECNPDQHEWSICNSGTATLLCLPFRRQSCG